MRRVCLRLIFARSFLLSLFLVYFMCWTSESFFLLGMDGCQVPSVHGSRLVRGYNSRFCFQLVRMVEK